MATKLYQDCPESYRDELTGLDTEITEFVDQLDDLRIQIRESERTLPHAKASTIHQLVETLAQIHLMEDQKVQASTACADYYNMQRGMEGQDEAECQEETAVETDDRVEQGNTGTV